MSAGPKIAVVAVVPPLIGAYPLYSYLTSGLEIVFLMNSDGEVDSEYTSGKFGYEYGNYMVHPKKENEKWWNKSFGGVPDNATIGTVFYNSSSDINGRKIEKAYSDSEDTALNRICDVIYKGASTNVNASGGAGKYKEDTVWRYCSVLEEKPKTISVKGESGEYSSLSNSLGNTKKDKLVAVNDFSNFWDFQEERFWKKDLSKFASSDSPFKQKRKEGVTGDGKDLFLNNLCKEEYKKEASAIESYKKDFWEFCSLTGREG